MSQIVFTYHISLLSSLAILTVFSSLAIFYCCLHLLYFTVVFTCHILLLSSLAIFTVFSSLAIFTVVSSLAIFYCCLHLPYFTVMYSRILILPGLPFVAYNYACS